MTKKRTFLRDVHSLMKTIASVTADQVTVLVESLEGNEGEDGGHQGSITTEVAPSDGAYKGAKFKFEIYVVGEYPENPPEVRCLTEIYHPNIDTEDTDTEGSNICVSLLETGEGGWDPNMTLEHCVQAILFLFYNPNWSDALSPLFSPDLTDTEFEENAKISIEGGDVDGRIFERNYGLPVLDKVTSDADGTKLTNQEIELNSINTALNNVTIDTETREITPTESLTTELETRVVTEDTQNENIVPACDTAQVNIEIPTLDLTAQEVDMTAQEVDMTTQEVDSNTQEIVGQEVEQLETNLVATNSSDSETVIEMTVLNDSVSEETAELITNSGEVTVSENKVNTDQGEIIKSDNNDNILSAMILDYLTVQGSKVDKHTGLLRRSLSVGDSPRGEIIQLVRSAMVGLSTETENKSEVCLWTNTESEKVCDIRTDTTEAVSDAELAYPYVVDDQQQLLPDCPANTHAAKDPRVTSPNCCGSHVICCNIS